MVTVRMSMLLSTLLVLSLVSSIAAQNIPTLVNYQGYLVDTSGSAVPDGNYNITFTIYDSETGGISYWFETQSVAVTNGLFNVQLGSVHQVSDDLFVAANRYLGLQVGSDLELTPRTKLTTVPYAFSSVRAESAKSAYDATQLVSPDGTPTPALYVDFDGNIGIGSIDPLTNLHVEGVGYFSDALGIGSSSTGNASLVVENSDTRNAAVITNINGGTGLICRTDEGAAVEASNRNSSPYFYADTYGYLSLDTIGVYGWSNTGSSGIGVKGYNQNYNNTGLLGGASYGVYGEVTSSSYHAGYFNGKVYASTMLGIGTETPGEELEISSADPVLNLNTSNVFGGIRWQQNGTNQWTLGWNENSQYIYYYRYGVGTVLAITDTDGFVGIGTTSPTQRLSINGNLCYTGSVVACSDARYKRDILTLSNSLEKVLQLRGVEYKWRTNEYPNQDFDDKKHLGFIAQEIEKYYPEIVITDNNGYKSVDYGRLTPVLVEAIKEIRAANDKEIADLKTEIAELKKVILQLAGQNTSSNSTYGLK